MLYSLDTYRALARIAGIAHREKDVPTATDAFKLLWQRLGGETSLDHAEARAVFNGAFANAYRGKADAYIDHAPAPAPTNGYCGADSPALAKSRVSRLPIDTRGSVALDCAAFFNAKVGA